MLTIGPSHRSHQPATVSQMTGQGVERWGPAIASSATTGLFLVAADAGGRGTGETVQAGMTANEHKGRQG